MTRSDYERLRQNGGIMLLGRPAMDLLEELVRIAENLDYPESVKIAPAHMKIVCGYSDAQYRLAREKLIEHQMINSYKCEHRNTYGTYHLNYTQPAIYTAGSSR